MFVVQIVFHELQDTRLPHGGEVFVQQLDGGAHGGRRLAYLRSAVTRDGLHGPYLTEDAALATESGFLARESSSLARATYAR